MRVALEVRDLNIKTLRVPGAQLVREPDDAHAGAALCRRRALEFGLPGVEVLRRVTADAVPRHRWGPTFVGVTTVVVALGLTGVPGAGRASSGAADILSRLPGARRRASPGAVDIGLPCESAFGERAPWQWHTMGESRATERPRRSSNCALRANSVAHCRCSRRGEQHLRCGRGASAPPKTRGIGESLAPPLDISRRSRPPPTVQFETLSRLFLLAAGARAAPSRARTRQAPQHGVPGHVSAPAHHLVPARAAPAPSLNNFTAPIAASGRHRRQRPIVALLSYGYVLYFASNLISEGSDHCRWCQASRASLGAAFYRPRSRTRRRDHAFFRIGGRRGGPGEFGCWCGRLGWLDDYAPHGPVGAVLCGSGRVDLDAEGKANMPGKPKLGANRGPADRGVSPGPQVKSGANIMVMTLVSYVIIQGPAFFMSGDSRAEVAENEKSWALLGLVTTLGRFVSYLYYQVSSSHAQDVQKKKQEAVMKTMLASGRHVAGRAHGRARVCDGGPSRLVGNEGGYGTMSGLDHVVKAKISEVVRPFFKSSTSLVMATSTRAKSRQCSTTWEDPPPAALDAIFDELDHDKNGTIDFDEFVTGIWSHVHRRSHESEGSRAVGEAIKRSGSSADDDEGEEDEEVPEDIQDLKSCRSTEGD